MSRHKFNPLWILLFSVFSSLSIASDVGQYPPRISQRYTPPVSHFVVPKGIMQTFCKDPESFRRVYPISFSEDEYRGMVDACFRFKREGKEIGDYQQ